MKASRVATLVVATTLAIAACGGDGGATTTQPTTTTSDATSTSSGVGKPSNGETGAVDNLEYVRGAIVRIVAEGSFSDPEFGQQYTAAGSGSGFFISSDGVAVTNNHVVTGAAFLPGFSLFDTVRRQCRRQYGGTAHGGLANAVAYGVVPL